MEYISKVYKTGNALAIIIPKYIAEHQEIKAGNRVKVDLKGNIIEYPSYQPSQEVETKKKPLPAPKREIIIPQGIRQGYRL